MKKRYLVWLFFIAFLIYVNLNIVCVYAYCPGASTNNEAIIPAFLTRCPKNACNDYLSLKATKGKECVSHYNEDGYFFNYHGSGYIEEPGKIGTTSDLETCSCAGKGEPVVRVSTSSDENYFYNYFIAGCNKAKELFPNIDYKYFLVSYNGYPFLTQGVCARASKDSAEIVDARTVFMYYPNRNDENFYYVKGCTEDGAICYSWVNGNMENGFCYKEKCVAPAQYNTFDDEKGNKAYEIKQTTDETESPIYLGITTFKELEGKSDSQYKFLTVTENGDVPARIPVIRKEGTAIFTEYLFYDNCYEAFKFKQKSGENPILCDKCGLEKSEFQARGLCGIKQNIDMSKKTIKELSEEDVGCFDSVSLVDGNFFQGCKKTKKNATSLLTRKMTKIK